MDAYIPRANYKQTLVQRTCQYDNCGEKFIGTKLSKYCTKHKKKNRHKSNDFAGFNKIIHHNYHEITKIEYKCKLDNCNNILSVNLYPLQYEYPAYCHIHNNPYKLKLATK